MSTMTPFRTQLEQAVNARHSRMNPFTEKWVNGELTREQLGSWCKQHYQYVSQFPRWCAVVYGGCPDTDARDFLLENIIEEESGTKHVDLLIRFAEACGVSRAEVEGARQLPSTRGLTAWCYETSRKPFHVAAAGLLVGLESQVPGIYKRNLPPLKTSEELADAKFPDTVLDQGVEIMTDMVSGLRPLTPATPRTVRAEAKKPG